MWLGHVLTLSESVFLNLENVLAADAHILKDYSDLVVRSSGKFASMSDSVRPHRRQPTKAPSSLGFSRQEHWSGLPLPSPMHESEK